MLRILILPLLVLAAPTAFADEKPAVVDKSASDYIERTGRIWGVQELILSEGGTATLVDARNSGPGHGMVLFNARSERVERVTLEPGQTCLLSDLRHAFLTLTLKAIRDGRAVFEITDRFNARSFGDGITETTRTFEIGPYPAPANPGP